MKNITNILLKILTVLLLIVLTIIFIVDINISKEFIIIIWIVLFLPITAIIIKMMSDMKKLEKLNEKIEKESEEYQKNKKKILSKFKKILIIFGIIEILFLGFLDIFLICQCGHHNFKILPILIVVIIQFFISLYYLKKIKNKDCSVDTLIKYALASFVLFLIVVILSKNDMDKLHKIDRLL